jgi:tetratricopeptide (TPR) repeat protein
MPLVLFLVFKSLAIILVFVTARYRVPMIPLFALLASAGLWHLAETMKKGQSVKVALMALFMVAVAFLSSIAGPFAAEKVNYEAEMYFCIGTEKRRQDRLTEAVPPLKAALELNPDYSDAHGELGYVRYQLGEREAAMIHLEKALELNPDLDSAHYNLATALLDEGKVGEAIPHLQEALRIYPINAEVHYKLGSALGQQGKPREAIVHFEKALEINPRSYGIHYNLGLARLQLGERDQGLEHLRKALLGAQAAGNQNMVNKIRTLVAQMKKSG